VFRWSIEATSTRFICNPHFGRRRDQLCTHYRHTEACQKQIGHVLGWLLSTATVTVLRNRTKELGEKAGVLVSRDYWELEAPAA
jgi:hypothetical protein